jgi:hypothetical protein
MAARRFFVYAPPLKGKMLASGALASRRKPVQPPYKNAPPMECSVYYYWWEYLRRHEGYLRTCERGGGGKYAVIYADFGDVHATGFWTWWRAHSELFSEPLPRGVELVDTGAKPAASTVLVSVPLENRAALSAKQLRLLLEPIVTVKKNSVTASRARYPVASKPHLPSLHQHLQVWDTKRANPSLEDWELADKIGLTINHVVDGGLTMNQLKMAGLKTERAERILKRRKQLAVQRHLRIAAQYINNVGKGLFPLRQGR